MTSNLILKTSRFEITDLKALTSNFCLEEHFFFPFGLPGFEAEPPCHCDGPVPSRGQNKTPQHLHQLQLCFPLVRYL